MLLLEVLTSALPASPPSAIPEASSLALLICGLAAVGVAARRRRIRELKRAARADEAL